ncbi:MAG: multiheme c-type cytochrome [Pseudomonadota bacterium]
MNRCAMWFVLRLFLGLFVTCHVLGNPELMPKHLGVASCASAVCHGSVSPKHVTSVSQNEYVIWSRHDRHRHAYKLLFSELSQRIAKNLGYDNAHEADVCLDCHADNVSHSERGERFQLSDGIGCEACHGGAEHYVSMHANPGVPRDDLLAAGLVPLDTPKARARVCFSCHVGNAEKSATHEIMGAGHPRLVFELDTFGVMQPAHYEIDEDYRSRKWSGDHLTVWALGQVAMAEHTLRRFRESLLSGQSLFPELSLYDCHACHHELGDIRWAQQRRNMLPPGSVRLNDAGLVMLMAIGQVLAPEVASRFRTELRELHRDSQERQGLDEAISHLESTVAELRERVVRARLVNFRRGLLDVLIQEGRTGSYRDYVAAEQAVMAIDLLMDANDIRQSSQSWVDQLFDSVANEDKFSPERFIEVLSSFDR